MWASLEAGRKRTLGAGGRNTRGGRKCCDKVALWPTVLFVLLTVHLGCFAAAPSEMELYPPMGATDTVITLNGAHFPTSSTVYCRIGKRLVLAEDGNATGHTGFQSVLLCKAPQQLAGFYSVEITHNGRDFTNSGLLFHYGMLPCLLLPARGFLS